MKKVYLVYYDNGQSWEDHYVTVNKVFASLEDATKYAYEKNILIQTYTPSVSEEKYTSENWIEDTGYTYKEFISSELDDWSRLCQARYYVSEQEVF